MTLIETKLLEFRKKFINDHNIGEERFLRGLFIEEFDEWVKSALEEVERKTQIEALALGVGK